MEFLVYGIIYFAGLCVGYVLRLVLDKFKHYSGTIEVTKTEGKTLYSLVLSDYPEKLEFQKEVLFRIETVDSPGESPVRE